MIFTLYSQLLRLYKLIDLTIRVANTSNIYKLHIEFHKIILTFDNNYNNGREKIIVDFRCLFSGCTGS